MVSGRAVRFYAMSTELNSDVPDMLNNPADPTSVVCKAEDDGCQTFYYTNQQSARLLFYHDHSWGITRLNVYAGEAAGYLITDETEDKLFGPAGLFPEPITSLRPHFHRRAWQPGRPLRPRAKPHRSKAAALARPGEIALLPGGPRAPRYVRV